MNTSPTQAFQYRYSRSKQRFGNGKWWGGEKTWPFDTPIPMVHGHYSLSSGWNLHSRGSVNDPTPGRQHSEVVGENPEAKFFSMLEEKFDLRIGARSTFAGDKEHSANGRDR